MAAELSGGVTFGQVRRSHSLPRWNEARMMKERKIRFLLGQRNGYKRSLNFCLMPPIFSAKLKGWERLRRAARRKGRVC